jgi:hypothetical protein
VVVELGFELRASPPVQSGTLLSRCINTLLGSERGIKERILRGEEDGMCAAYIHIKTA